MRIIDGKQRKGIQLLELIITIGIWTLFILFLMYLIPPISKKYFTANENTTLIFALILSGISLFIVLSSTISWSAYNKKKYGGLNRRRMPNDVSVDELSKAYRLSLEEVNHFQTGKWIDVEKQFTKLDLQAALDRAQFFLVFQPQFHFKTGAVKGVEAHIRWEHPKRGCISSEKFLPIAREVGLMIPICEWLLTEACKQTKLWRERGFSAVTVKVKIPEEPFYQANFIEFVDKVLQQTKIEPASLGVEVTEHTITQDIDQALSIFNELKRLGIQREITNYGTGLFSFEYLQSLPINTLKMDRSFTANLYKDPKNNAIVESIIHLAHSLELNIIADGVESEAQLDFLKQHQCNDVQGDLLSQPLSSREFEEVFIGQGEAAVTKI